jgi:hypothetical protein
VRINLDEAPPGTTVQGVTIGADGGPELAANQTLVAIVPHIGVRYAIVDRPIDSVIRGLHFIHEETDEPPEDNPPAADLLNPDAIACFVRLVYARFYTEFGAYFGDTVRAIFTDEPALLGRPRERGVQPWTTGLETHINAYLGYDFVSHLPALWDNDAPKAVRDDFERAVEYRLQQTYYQQLYAWCEAHGIALTGHPAEPDGTAHMRYFHWPGQDIVWRWVEPDSSTALEGRQSTQGKAAASVMLHDGRRRNANEFCGAFGPDLTYDEMRWLANWLLARGCNLLIPHAFYYSIRGPRQHERPPDLGLSSPWWGEPFTRFAQAARRLCWLNTDSQQVCHVAILGENHRLPWRAARACFEHQIDFNYLDADDLLGNAQVSDAGIHIAGQHYPALIVDDILPPNTEAPVQLLDQAGRVIRWNDDRAACVSDLRKLIPPDVRVRPAAPGLRVRHVHKAGRHWYILFNEGAAPVTATVEVSVPGAAILVDPDTGAQTAFAGQVQLAGHELRVLVVKRDGGD